MHILIIHQIFVTPEEGGGTRHYELARYLVSKGHSVTVIASDIDYLSGKRKSNSDETRDGIRILYARTLKTVHKNFVYRAMSFLSFTVSSFIKALRVGNVDVVWGTSPPLFQSLAALTVAKLRGAPFVFEVRDLWIDFAEQLSVISNRYMIRALKIVERILYRSADKIIINSPGFEPFVAKHITGGKEICLVPNGVITSDFDIRDLGLLFFRKKYELADKFIAIYLGNLGVANDIEMILDAAERLKGIQDLLIVLMGGGIKKDHFKDLIAQRGLSNVLLCDTMPKSAIPHILADVDVGIASLKNIPMFTTTYPNKVFDYMAAQIPTVLAIDGVIREVIELSGGGTYVPPGDSAALADAIMKYHDNPQLVTEHGRNAKKYVKEHFEREKIADRLEHILGSLYSPAGRF